MFYLSQITDHTKPRWIFTLSENLQYKPWLAFFHSVGVDDAFHTTHVIDISVVLFLNLQEKFWLLIKLVGEWSHSVIAKHKHHCMQVAKSIRTAIQNVVDYFSTTFFRRWNKLQMTHTIIFLLLAKWLHITFGLSCKGPITLFPAATVYCSWIVENFYEAKKYFFRAPYLLPIFICT